MLGEYGLRVKLYTLDLQLAVSHAHDLVEFTIRSFGPRGYFQAVRRAFCFDRQGMVAGGFAGILESAEHSGVAVVNHGGLAVHDGSRPNDFSAEGLADALVTQADPQYGNLASESFNGR